MNSDSPTSIELDLDFWAHWFFNANLSDDDDIAAIDDSFDTYNAGREL